jgi:hypothetical protein
MRYLSLSRRLYLRNRRHVIWQKFIFVQRNVLHHSPGLKSKPNKNVSSYQYSAAWLLFDPEDGGNMFTRNEGSLPDYMESYPRWQYALLFSHLWCFPFIISWIYLVSLWGILFMSESLGCSIVHTKCKALRWETSRCFTSAMELNVAT